MDIENEDLEEKQLQYKMQHDEEMDFVMGSPVGRRFMFRLIYGQCGVDRETFSVEPALSNYAQGRQSIGAELKRDVVGFNAGLFLKMEEENYGR